MFLRQDLNASGLVLALAMAITVLMELPFFFYSKNMLNMIGISGCVVVGHLALITRSLSYPLLFSLSFSLSLVFLLHLFRYSFLTNPWWVLPVEITHGIAFSCIWTAGVTYFGQLAPKGREATFQVSSFHFLLFILLPLPLLSSLFCLSPLHCKVLLPHHISNFQLGNLRGNLERWRWDVVTCRR